MRAITIPAPKTRSTRILAFNAVGLVGFAVQIGALWLLVRVGGVSAVLAAALAVEAAVLHNFICHWCWTWSDRVGGGHEFLVRLARFNLTNGAVSLAVNVALMTLLQRVLGLHFLLATLAGVLCSSIANFALGDRVVFAPRGGARCGRQGGGYWPRTFAISSRSAGWRGTQRPETSI